MKLKEFNHPDKIIRSLSVDIWSNETCHPTNPQLRSEQIERVYDWWTSENSVAETFDWIRFFPIENEHQEGKNSPSWIELFSVGLLGLARQRVVNLNTQLKTADKEKQMLIVQALNDVNNKVYQKIRPDQAPPFTIHGDPIHWEGEVAQDKGISFERSGDKDKALHIYIDAIHRLEDQINEYLQTATEPTQQEQINTRNKFTHRLVLLFNRLPQIVDYQSTSREESALRTALGTLKVRKGQLTHTTKDVWEGILLRRSSMKYRDDENRMDDLTRLAAISSLRNILRIQNLPWTALTLSYTAVKIFSHKNPIKFISGK